MSDCLFCKIVNNEIPSNRVFEDEHVIVFHDINPEAPFHVLVIPRKHFQDVTQLSEESQLSAHVMSVAASIGKTHAPGGFRIVLNTGDEGGQTVEHVHAHVLAGRQMKWPPG